MMLDIASFSLSQNVHIVHVWKSYNLSRFQSKPDDVYVNKIRSIKLLN